MNILSIETSADETAVSVVQVTGEFPTASYELLGNALRSQAELHQGYGGIFPTIAKREHARALLPLLEQSLKEAHLVEPEPHKLPAEVIETLNTLLYREPDAAALLIPFLEQYNRPEIDMIAVTSGPGLEPALWVGVNFAKALATVWNIPVVPVNHIEGHVLASVFDVEEDNQLAKINFPALALLISGGHTELLLMQNWKQYEKIGETKDDAVGEAFDKVARLLGLPYPGGVEIDKLAERARKEKLPPLEKPLPRPMLTSGDLHFSFSGLKTAVRYAVQDQELSETAKAAWAREFQDAVTEVLLAKAKAAVDQFNIQTLIIGGGVSASRHLRQSFHAAFLESHPDLAVYFPTPGLSTDNSIMIALAGHAKIDGKLAPQAAVDLIKADGNKSLG